MGCRIEVTSRFWTPQGLGNRGDASIPVPRLGGRARWNPVSGGRSACLPRARAPRSAWAGCASPLGSAGGRWGWIQLFEGLDCGGEEDAEALAGRGAHVRGGSGEAMEGGIAHGLFGARKGRVELA